MRLRVKVWLEQGGKVFGDGICDLLARVQRHRSLRAAAGEIGMSYAQAWHLIRDAEKRLGCTLLASAAGGPGGGGSRLTGEGCELLGRWQRFRDELQVSVEDGFRRHMEGVFPEWQPVAPGRRGEADGGVRAADGRADRDVAATRAAETGTGR